MLDDSIIYHSNYINGTHEDSIPLTKFLSLNDFDNDCNNDDSEKDCKNKEFNLSQFSKNISNFTNFGNCCKCNNQYLGTTYGDFDLDDVDKIVAH